MTAPTAHHGPAVDDRAIPGTALLLGLGGVLPFAALALAAWLDWDRRIGLPPGVARAALVGYGVAIASFLGGVRWGIGIMHGDTGRRSALLAMSVLAPLGAWCAVFMPRPLDLVVLIGCFLVLGYSDVSLARAGTVPRWYGTLRLILTSLVVGVLIVALAVLPFEA